jgi:hypothetical protein
MNPLPSGSIALCSHCWRAYAPFHRLQHAKGVKRRLRPERVAVLANQARIRFRGAA